ncbi:hypothetical protein RCO48_32130 [Peribacillus frigoritolerans]|nr:hypothetical protein [Peribacillus frigoritolerans]
MLKRRTNFSSYLDGKLIEQKQRIDNKWIKLRDGNDSWTEQQKVLLRKILDGIEIYADIHFDKDTLYTKLEKHCTWNKI